MDRFAIRRGSGVPAASDLAEFELGYRTEAKSLYIGTSSGPIRIASANCAEGRFPNLRLTGIYQASQVPNSTIFEGPEGTLFYKNRYGVSLKLADLPENEDEDDEEEEE